MSAPADQALLAVIQPPHLPDLLAIEQRVFSHPWTRKNFEDSLASSYRLQGLWQAQSLIGYSVSMAGVDELHLLNFAVAPERQGQGHARGLLRDLCEAARDRKLGCIWLEVRRSNAHAIAVYEHLGFARVGLRKGYYPKSPVEREDAITMSLQVASVEDAT